MKKLLLLTLLMPCISKGQIVSKQLQHDPNKANNKFALATPKRDTLFLLNNLMGKNTIKIWEMDKAIIKEKKPVFIFTTPEVLAQKEAFYYTKSLSANKNK